MFMDGSQPSFELLIADFKCFNLQATTQVLYDTTSTTVCTIYIVHIPKRLAKGIHNKQRQQHNVIPLSKASSNYSTHYSLQCQFLQLVVVHFLNFMSNVHLTRTIMFVHCTTLNYVRCT